MSEAVRETPATANPGASELPALGEARAWRLDPRASLLGLVLLNLAVFFSTSSELTWAMMTFECLLMLAARQGRLALGWLVCYLAFFGAGLGFARLGGAVQGMALSMVTLSRMLPIGACASLMIATTSTGEMASALQAAGFPSRFAVAICVGLRFFPAAAREATAVHEALLTRGIRMTPLSFAKNPRLFLERFFVPYLHRIATTADELGNAVVVRAIESPGKRTCYYPMRWSLADTATLCVFSLFLAASIAGRLGL